MSIITEITARIADYPASRRRPAARRVELTFTTEIQHVRDGLVTQEHTGVMIDKVGRIEDSDLARRVGAFERAFNPGKFGPAGDQVDASLKLLRDLLPEIKIID